MTVPTELEVTADCLAVSSPTPDPVTSSTVAVGRAPWSGWERWARWLRANAGFLAGMAAVLGIVVFVIFPVLHSGYSGDDVPNSQVPMQMRAAHLSFWFQLKQQTLFWMRAFGRFFPMSTAETMAIFAIFSTRAAYKVFQVVAVLGSVTLLMVTVSVLARRRAIGILAGAIVALSLQIRIFHDPILQFSAQQAIVVSLLMATLLCFHLSLSGHRPWLLVPTGLFWVIALLTYETMYFLTPIFVFALLLSRATWRERIRSLAVLAIPVLMLLGFVAHLRSQAKLTAPQYTANLDPGRVLATLYNQAGAALPMSYAAYHPNPAIRPLAHAWKFSGIVDASIFVLTAAVLLVTILRLRKVGWRVLVFLALSGLLLWLLPALIVSATKKWQDELSPGVGYVSVFVEYFGVALLLTAGITALATLLRSRVRPILGVLPLAVILCIVGAYAVQTTADNNDIAVNAFSTLLYPREAFHRGIHRGMLDGVPAGSRLESLEASPWVNAPFIAWYGGPTLDVPADPINLEPCTAPTGVCAQAPPAWVVSHTATPHFAVVLVGHYGAGRVPAANIADAFSSDIVVYVERPGLDATSAATLVPQTEWAATPGLVASNRSFRPGEVQVERSGPGWAILRIRPATGVLSMHSLRAAYLATAPPGG